jgi:hypothetical protein
MNAERPESKFYSHFLPSVDLTFYIERRYSINCYYVTVIAESVCCGKQREFVYFSKKNTSFDDVNA